MSRVLAGVVTDDTCKYSPISFLCYITAANLCSFVGTEEGILKYEVNISGRMAFPGITFA